MLRITTKTEASKTTFELEGTLAGAWVGELERCWQEIGPDQAVKVSLEAVTFIDDAGKRLLARLHQSGAELNASGCMNKCIVQEIISQNERTH
jgi:anti-anti-sigma regulatory factor